MNGGPPLTAGGEETATSVSLHQQISARIIHDLMTPPSVAQLDGADELRAIDHCTLMMEAVLHSIVRVGIGGASTAYAIEGATKDEMYTYMVGRLIEQSAYYGLSVGVETLRAYAARSLDRALGHGGSTAERTFRPFGSDKVVSWRIFNERYAADGLTGVVVAAEQATNAVFQSLSFDIADANAANRFMIGHQLRHKEFDRLLAHLVQDGRLARAFSAEIVELLSGVRYQIRRTDWRRIAPRIERARREAEETIAQDATLRRGIQEAVQDASPEDRVRLRRIDAVSTETFTRHAALSGEIMLLHEEFLERRSIQGMRAPSAVVEHDPEADIMLPLLAVPAASFGGEPVDALEALRHLALPTSADPVHWLMRLLTVRRSDDGPGGDDDPDYDDEIEVDNVSPFEEWDEPQVDDMLTAFGVEREAGFRLVDFLRRLEEAGKPARLLNLTCLLVATVFVHGSDRWSVELAGEDGAGDDELPRLDASGFLLDAAGVRLAFEDHQVAARWLADRRLGHAAEREVHPENDAILLLRARATWTSVRAAAGGRIETDDLVGRDFDMRLLDAGAPLFRVQEESDDV